LIWFIILNKIEIKNLIFESKSREEAKKSREREK
jgi:hypothetical protein